jgi:multiple sugar transport system ATP-binding protein
MASIRTRALGKSYGPIRIMSDVDLEVRDKEFVVLLGPSGCGKTTLLRMIAGLEDITSGEILIGERVVNDVRERDRDIAMIFQNYALFPHMTVRGNITFGLKLRRTSSAEIERRVAWAGGILGLNDYLERYPRQLSGGQRQRVAMARAIVREPVAFLFDEPLSNLDAQLRAQMRSELRALQQRLKITTVYVTHDQVSSDERSSWRTASQRRWILVR